MATQNEEPENTDDGAEPGRSTADRILSQLGRIAGLLEERRLGLQADAPGRHTIYAARHDNSLWHFWNQETGDRIPIEAKAVAGYLTNIFCYRKESSEGTSIKVRICLQCGPSEYELETSLHAVSGRTLMGGLLEAGRENLTRSRVTIAPEPGKEKEAVLFLNVFTSAGGTHFGGGSLIDAPNEQAVTAVQSVRTWLGLSEDVYDNRISNRDPHEAGGSSSGHSPGGSPSGGQFPGDDLYSGQQPPPHGSIPDEPDGHEPTVPQASATHQARRKGSGSPQGATPQGPAPRGDGAAQKDYHSGPFDPKDVGCTTCDAKAGQNCITEQGEGREPHPPRKDLADAKSGNAEKMLELIAPWLDGRSGKPLLEVIRDVAKEIARWDEEAWTTVVEGLEDYHESARQICEDRREPVAA